MRLHRTYPLWLHVVHVVYHGGGSGVQLAGFIASFLPSKGDPGRSESVGPGWRFRYVTTWILTTLALYLFAAFAFDIVLILRGANDSITKRLRVHLDRFFVLMYSTSVGMGFFFHLLFFISCARDHRCPHYTDSLWFIHLMPFWYGLFEQIFAPHSTRRDVKTTPLMVLVFCVMYCSNYWLFVAQTHGHHPYGDPWPVWQWIVFFCFPLTTLVLWLLSLLRNRVLHKRQWRSPFGSVHLDTCEMQPVNWRALGAMTGLLLISVSIWNLSFLIASR